MNKHYLLALIVILLAAALAGAAYVRQEDVAQAIADDQAVRAAVLGFGSVMQKVSLLAPDAPQEVEAAYAPYASSSLIAQWQGNLLSAPGRTTSSPWPDHINIDSDTKQPNGTYIVDATVVEVTSNEVEHGGIAADFPVTLTLAKYHTAWLITGYQAGPETVFASATTTATTSVAQ
jgi:hypothetical protein